MEKEEYRIAIVEDDLLMAKMLKSRFSLVKINASVFNSGRDFINSKFTAGIILLDLSLTDIDCLEFILTIYKINAKYKLVLMSGSPLSKIELVRAYAKSIGFEVGGILKKPFSKEEMFAAVGVKFE